VKTREPELLFVAIILASLLTLGCSEYAATRWVTGILAVIGCLATVWLIGTKER